MICKVDGCGKPVKFKGEQLCQAHYFRRMRYGTFDLTRKPGRPSFIRPDGYVMIRSDNTRFSRNGYAFEHRIVAYAKYGERLPDCEFCGMKLDWSFAVVDHIDEVRINNSPENLRPLCSPCNIKRTVRLGISYRNAQAVTHNGKTLTPTEWAREPGVEVHGATIRQRLRKGATTEEAIYGPKITHNGNLPPPRPPAAPKHKRRNAVNLVIDGDIRTAAEWARDPRCNVSRATLKNRVAEGWPHTECILRRVKSPDKPKHLPRPIAPSCEN